VNFKAIPLHPLILILTLKNQGNVQGQIYDIILRVDINNIVSSA